MKWTDDGALVNNKELAKLLKVDPRTITTWIEQGLPLYAFGGRGHENEIYVHEAIEWRVKNEVSKISNYEHSKAELTYWQAEEKKRQVAAMDRELLPASEVNQGWATMISNARAKLLSMPTKLAPLLATLNGNTPEIKKILDEEIYQALEELATDELDIPAIEGDPKRLETTAPTES